MGDLGEALVLMHGARERFRTVRATARVWRHTGRARGLEDVDHGFRLWVEKPDRVREEHDPNGRRAEIQIRDGERWWTYDSAQGLDSNEADLDLTNGKSIGHSVEHLLDPSPLLGQLRFKPLGRARVAEREAICLRASPRQALDYPVDLYLGQGAEEYELAIDAARGVVLRAAALVDRAEYQVTELVEVAFDERFPPDTFTLTLPAGAEARPPDRLTGLPSTRVFVEHLRTSAIRALAAGDSFSFVLFDLDDLKAVNDRHGTASGDLLISAFTNVLRDFADHQECVSRFGGDEFALALPGYTALEAAEVAERIRSAFAPVTVTTPDGVTIRSPTVSAGVAALDHDLPDGPDVTGRLFFAAEDALTYAQTQGKDRVATFSTTNRRDLDQLP